MRTDHERIAMQRKHTDSAVLDAAVVDLMVAAIK